MFITSWGSLLTFLTSLFIFCLTFVVNAVIRKQQSYHARLDFCCLASVIPSKTPYTLFLADIFFSHTCLRRTKIPSRRSRRFKKVMNQTVWSAFYKPLCPQGAQRRLLSMKWFRLLQCVLLLQSAEKCIHLFLFFFWSDVAALHLSNIYSH